MNGQFETPGGKKRTSDDTGRGPRKPGLGGFVVFAIAVVVVLVVILSIVH